MYSDSGLLYRIRITVTSSNILIGVRIKNDICIRVRVTGIRVRITSRVRIAEVVLGCSGHYIDPGNLRKTLTRYLPLTKKLDLDSNVSSSVSVKLRIMLINDCLYLPREENAFEYPQCYYGRLM